MNRLVFYTHINSMFRVKVACAHGRVQLVAHP